MTLPSYPWRFAHLAALWGYGVSQPVFALLKGNPEFLIINGASRSVTVTFALVLAFGPPVAVVAAEMVVDVLSAKIGALLHVAALWLFGFAAALQVLARFDPSSEATLLVPAALAYAGAIAYTRWSVVRSFLSVSLVLPVIALVLFVTTAPLAVADAKSAGVAVPGQTPVVLVVFDEFTLSSLLRADGSLDAARYPGFGRLAGNATWYSRATTVGDQTTSAVPAILSGDLPEQGDLPTLSDYPHNLFTLLGGSYAFRVHESVTRLCPVTYCPTYRSNVPLHRRVDGLIRDIGTNYLQGVLPRSMRGDVSPLREGWGALVDNIGRWSEFTESIVSSNPSRTLYAVHVVKPHVPWSLLPSGRRYNDASVISGIEDGWEPGRYERWRRAQWLVDGALQRYLLQVRYVDRDVAHLLRRLDETGVYDRALVVVTADHGVSFRPGSWRRHATPENLADIATVPLFVKYPGQKHGREDRRAAETIDILPTIADVLGVSLPWQVDGRSLRGRPVQREVRVARRDEETVVAPRAAVAAEVLRTARRQAALFGEGSESLYRIGPRRSMLGRSAARFAVSVAADARVDVRGAINFENVRKASGFVPVHVLARISWDALRQDEDVAIAVNGHIAAVTRPFVTLGETWIEAMIDESVLHEGNNGLEVFTVRGAGRATRLTRLGGNETGA